MNTINLLKITANDETWNFLNGDVRIQRSFTDTSEELFTAVELTNSVYYSNEKLMKQKQWNFVARLENDNDFKFKRFLNSKDKTGRKQAQLQFDINVNGVSYVVYGVLASQESVIDYGVIKEYRFTVNISSRALTFTRIEQKPIETNGEKYGVGKYGVAKYSGIQDITTFQFNFDNNADTDSYFTIKGNGLNGIVYFMINNTKIEFNLSKLGLFDTFEYSNIPLNLKVNINGEKRLDILKLNQNNFIIDTLTGVNNVLIYGLQNIEVDIVKGYKII